MVREQFPLCHRFTLRRWEQAGTCNYPCSPSRGPLGSEEQLARSLSPLSVDHLHTHTQTPTHVHTHAPAHDSPPYSDTHIPHIHLPGNLINKATAHSEANHRERQRESGRISAEMIQQSLNVTAFYCLLFMHAKKKVISHPV